MQMSVAKLIIEGISPLSQSRQHEDAKLDGESHYDYDLRTWRSKLNVSRKTGTVVLPAHGIQQCITAAAKYTGEQIKGQGKKTWTAKFERGIALFDDFDTGVKPEDFDAITISANADGVRGSGKRVPRKFPIAYEWQAVGEIHILDPIITEERFRHFFEIAGLFIGMGRFRPEKGGTNGRFKIKSLEWEDNRSLVA